MISKTTVKSAIGSLCEEFAVRIGGLIALHRVPDDFVWDLMRNLEAARMRTLEELRNGAVAGTDGETVVDNEYRPHPAVEEFLRRIRSK